jgi:DNA-directed RNA polymerase subunit RPC12/RpoP
MPMVVYKCVRCKTIYSTPPDKIRPDEKCAECIKDGMEIKLIKISTIK